MTNLSRFLQQEILRSLAPLLLLVIVWSPFAIATHFAGAQESQAWFALISTVVLLIYAYFSAAQRNPVLNQPYGLWLQQTPWQWGRPLPLGWVRLSLSEALVVVGFAALFPFGFAYGLAIGATTYGLGYLVSQLITSSDHKEPILPIGAFLLAGLGLAFSVGPNGPTPIPLLVALAAAVGLSQFTLPLVLQRFDELDIGPSKGRLAPLAKDELRRQGRVSGSPWNELLENIGPAEEKPIKFASWLVPSLLCLWLFGCFELARYRLFSWAGGLDFETLQTDTTLWGGFRTICYLACHPESSGTPARTGDALTAGLWAGALLLLMGALVYVGARVTTHWPPINPLGRIATGQLIIPGYDYVFIGPIAAVVTYALIGLALSFFPALGLFAGGIALAGALIVFAKLSPTSEEWLLTGHHRIMCSAGTSKR